jgi:serine/threonine-protein kinase HipA
MAQLFSLEPGAALREARAVARVVDGWKDHFRKCRVTASDIRLLAEQVDRPFLLDQRRQVLGRA